MKLKNSKILYSLFILVLYLVLGTLLMLKYLVWQEVPSLSHALFGFVVIAYGVFRGYRAYKAYQTEKEDEIE